MIENQIEFLHVCETNEIVPNFDLSKSKSHITIKAPVPNNFTKESHLIKES